MDTEELHTEGWLLDFKGIFHHIEDQYPKPLYIQGSIVFYLSTGF